MSKIIKLEKSLQLKTNIGEIYTREQEIEHINQLYLGTPNRVLTPLIKKKLSSYRQQDRVKKRHDPERLITLDETVELLVASQLKCHYCRQEVQITGDKRREKHQWTLDRIDNNLGHFGDNVIIACLDCNLKRRCINKEKFLFTKRLRVEKGS
jgi:hypothetical protein